MRKHLPDHLRPRLRVLLLALQKRPSSFAWAECWRYFRHLEGKPEVNLIPRRH